ncbi:MAG: isopentenyl phosphate kinase family protein [Candidatus Thermoplasmatota archaeon]|nr:isopentenyl phosphate kinase family protein [Euryarchaeota archaeon]MBU4032454.1 isopentenyl phosphate kinase family protein [Candidatus Thermoplasmatota archaeon]MBU4071567.1 isopentenyl phosphate kinase family protein [Candidatus Thermoplasmatota archaeon]MBU4144466.1 isopentenyl phosphate kinase family protein [Candidatus Thermoplasmatota archaeon]MBU4592302.1 isopentenyl phosphate kinase family protein [Candidatus Thermoplasmatota archaeon]
MILIKLGGSVVTDKSKPMTSRPEVIDRLAMELSKIPGPKIIIHGGGSFGHIKAKQYALHTGFTDESQREGICQVQNDMRALNRLIEESLRKAGVPVASIPAGAIATFDNGALASFPSDVFQHYLDIGITPISFGDVVMDRSRGISICSGDDIMLKLAADLKAEICIFVTAVDGIFPTYPPAEGQGPLPEIGRDDAVAFTVKDADVTGSMQRKLKLMFDIANLGTKVQIVNGLVPGRLADALSGKFVIGTVVRGD